MAERDALLVGSRWRNRHTGRETTVLRVGDETRPEPTRLGQKPDGQLIFAGHRPVTRPWVWFEGGAPPGYNQAVCGGWSVEEFLRHYEPAPSPVQESRAS